jgi:hypothetical protein
MLCSLGDKFGPESTITVAEITVYELIGIIVTILGLFSYAGILVFSIYSMLVAFTEKPEVRKEIKKEYEAKYGKNQYEDTEN